MENVIEKKWFVRTLEVLPGAAAWLTIISPFILAAIAPLYLGIFIIVYSFYWLCKSLNISRHLFSGYFKLRHNMDISWLEYCQKTEDIRKLEKYLDNKYQESKKIYDWEDLLWVQNLEKDQNKVLDWKEIEHLVIVAVSKERLDILEPTMEAMSEVNYPLDKIRIIFAAEAVYKDDILSDLTVLNKKYGKKFKDLRWYWHEQAEGEVRGKGPNITFAGKSFWKEFEGKLDPEKCLVTNIDADHIVHKEYFGRLSYLYTIDPARETRSYQPIPLLFNNIWDVPAANRIAAVSSSFWQLVESMRPFRLRTFAAHTQSLSMLLMTDFWSVKTIVEDGHQYWRSYFALNGEHHMIPLFLPVYQDAVVGESLWEATKNQYLQKRRWAWGVSDFPYIVINSIKHKEIPFFNRFLQVFRHFTGIYTWATSSFVLSLAWIPLLFNQGFQDTVLAHNIAIFSSQMLRVAWIGIVLNVWISLILLPKRPAGYGKHKNLGMVFMWILSPPYAIFLSSLPALDSQTRLMLGKKLEVFWITPKFRKTAPTVSKKS